MNNGEILEKELERIASGDHLGATKIESRELAGWLLVNSIDRFASFLFIAEVMFTKFPSMLAEMNKEVYKNWTGRNVEELFNITKETDEVKH